MKFTRFIKRSGMPNRIIIDLGCGRREYPNSIGIIRR